MRLTERMLHQLIIAMIPASPLRPPRFQRCAGAMKTWLHHGGINGPPNVKRGGSKGGCKVVQLSFHQPMRNSVFWNHLAADHVCKGPVLSPSRFVIFLLVPSQRLANEQGRRMMLMSSSSELFVHCSTYMFHHSVFWMVKVAA